jgi:DNA-binding MarR family transcriptional regulator
MTLPPDEVLREFVGYNAKRALAVIQTDVNAALKPFGLRMVTYSALIVIARNPGLKQADLAEALAIERPNIVPIIDELQAAKLVVRKRLPEDRRAYALHVTLPGQQVADAATIAVEGHNARMTAGMTDEEVVILNAALRRVENSRSRGEEAGGVSKA